MLNYTVLKTKWKNIKIDPITQVLDLIKDQKYATEEEITAIEKRVKASTRMLILLKNLITLRCNNYMM
jgi:TPP-dependent pyruvate/acetoin dehydrogenase alpha subunit